MIKSLKFSHKILLAASLVVFAAFALFTLYSTMITCSATRSARTSKATCGKWVT